MPSISISLVWSFSKYREQTFTQYFILSVLFYWHGFYAIASMISFPLKIRYLQKFQKDLDNWNTLVVILFVRTIFSILK